MARINSTPKGTPANRKGANMKKQKKITKKKKETLENKSEVKKETKQTLKTKTPKTAPEVKKVELTIENIANNKFEELAVAVAYAKNDQEKEAAVKAFADFFNSEIPDNKKTAIKEILANRLKEDDFMFGNEFIKLTGLRQYQDKLFEERKVEKEFEEHSSTLEDKTPEKISVTNAVTPSLSEKELHQALVDGINNEEIKNIKGYSKEDLQKILDCQEELLNGSDNARAFESLHENSIADLKKFADGTMTIDNDSYETMLQFIKVFGTNHKGELTPEGKAAYDKLMDLMAQAKKEKILKNKEDYQKKAAIAGIVSGLEDNAAQREETPEASDFAIGMDTPEENNTNNKEEKTPAVGIIPVPSVSTNTNGENNTPISPTQSANGNNTTVPPVVPVNNGKINEPQKKKGWWGRLKDKVKRNWKKIAGWAAAAATAAALLLLPKNCNGNDAVSPQQDDGKNNIPDKEIVVAPDTIVQDTITLDQNDLVDGFYLERSAGFKAEQEKINFQEAEKANKTDLLTIKKLITHGNLDQSNFVRPNNSKNDEPVSVAEIAYKMRIVTQNFPNSKVAASVKNMFSGKVSDQDAENIYAAFKHVDDFGNILNNKGKIIEGIPGKKTIDSARMGPGSEEYGTQGADNNFLQVLKNHRNTHNL